MDNRRFNRFLVVAFLMFAVYMWGVNAYTSRNNALNKAKQVAVDAKKADDKKSTEKAADGEAKKSDEANVEAKKTADVKPVEPAIDAKEEEADVKKQPEEPERWFTLGSVDPNSPYRMLATFSSRGAALARIELSQTRYRDVDDRSGYLGEMTIDNSVEGAGLKINYVGAGTPAAKAGLKPGDILKEFDGAPVSSGKTLKDVLQKKKPGKKYDLVYARDGKEGKAAVELIRRPLAVVAPEGKDPLSMLMTLDRVGDKSFSELQRGKEAKFDEELPQVALRKSVWTVAESTEDKVVFRKTLAKLKLDVYKTYQLVKTPEKELKNPDYPSYHLDVSVRIVNSSTAERVIAYRLDGPTGLPLEGAWYASKVSRNWGAGGLRDVVASFNHATPVMINCPTIATDEQRKRNAAEKGEDYLVVNLWQQNSLSYIGVDAQYFAATLIPQLPKDEKKNWFAASYPICVGPVSEQSAFLTQTDVSFRLISESTTLKPGEELSHQFQLFAGPKQADLLDKYNLGELIYYGWFSWVAKVLAVVLHFFYSIVRNYGIAIILLTVLVRGCMFPVSRKQALGAQKMAEIQPEMKKITEKFKKDPQARNQAMQELYQKYNYNPLSGCLLLFVQLPIFVGLYRSLMVDIELRDAPLISEAVRWCSNLAAPDMLFNWASFMPDWITKGPGFLWLGPYFNILPFATIILFIWQQKIMMPPGRRRTTSHAAENYAIHDDRHGRIVLQSGKRFVHLLHRIEFVGRRRTRIPPQAR